MAGQPSSAQSATSPAGGVTGLVDLVHMGGEPVAVAAVGRYAYTAVGPTILVVDIGDPDRPIRVGSSELLPDTVGLLAVAGRSLIAAVGESLVASFDIARPQEVRLLGSLPIDSQVVQLLTVGTQVVLLERGGRLTIADFADPARPLVRSSGRIDGATGLTVAGGLAYVNTEAGRVTVLDIKDPDNIVRQADLPWTRVQGVASDGHWLYLVTDAPWGVWVLDLAQQPLDRTALFVPAATDIQLYRPVAHDGWLLLYSPTAGEAAEPNNLLIGLRPADPGPPRWRELAHGSAELVAMGFAGPIALVRSWAAGELQLFDLSAPNEPARRGIFRPGPPAFPIAVASAGGYAYLISTNGLDVLDLRSPRMPRVVAAGLPGGATYAAVAVSGKYLATVGWTRNSLGKDKGALHAFDLANPERPRHIGQLDILGWQLAVGNGVAWILVPEGIDGERLMAVALDGPDAFRELYSMAMPQSLRAQELALDGSTLYLAGDELWSLDVSDPRQPRTLDSVSLPSMADGIALGHEALFVPMINDRMLVVDVADPASLVPMTDIPFLGDHIALSGRWLLAITRQLTLMDVGQPCRPLERFSEPWPIYPVSFAVEGGTVAMADGSSGLIVGRLAPPGDGVDGTPAPDVPCPPTLTPVPTFAPPTPTATRTPFPSATRPVPTSPIRLTATQVLPRRTRSTPVRSVLWLPIGHR